jgi:uncharacterized membrane protein HdeD (DUF308 family)
MAYVSNPPPSPQAPSGQQQIYPPPDEQRTQRTPGETTRVQRTTIGVLTGGSSLELLGGAIAVVLAILGLANYNPFFMAAIATILIGAALLAFGIALAARWNDTVRRMGGDQDDLAAGVGTEIVGGITGIILGVLALAGVEPLVVLPVAAIVFGGALLLGAAAQPRLAVLSPDRDDRFERTARRGLESSSGVMVLIGIAAVVLGLLGLIEVGPPLTLTLVAMLVIGAALVVAGGAATVKFGHRLQQVTA